MDYAQLREKYSYDAVDLELNIKATENTKEIVSKGIYAKTPAAGGINLRKFEKIVNSVFTDFAEDTSKKVHIDNLKEIIYAIVYWKMSSQGGRAKRSRKNVLEKWSEETERMLYNGFVKEDFKAFKIGGVRIPTASAIIRFIYPNKYGLSVKRASFTQPDSKHFHTGDVLGKNIAPPD